PYGRFERQAGCAHEIWIGGGVGISPFLAWMKDQSADRFDQVTLFYFFSPGRAFPDVGMLQSLADDKGIEFVPIDRGPESSAFTQRFTEILRDKDASSVDIAVCGPQGLLDKVRKSARQNDFNPGRIRHELFAFR